MRPARRSRPFAAAAVVATTLLSACVFKLDIQQGNLLEREQVDSVEVGMTRSQVRFLLGTPMIADPFDQSRWDYVFFYRNGKTGDSRKFMVVVWFDGDTVTKIDRPGQDEAGSGTLAAS
jgi:outer membrane protein assembly factor BamE